MSPAGASPRPVIFRGDFLEARTHYERAIEVCDPEHEADTRERFGEDTGTVASTSSL